MSELGALPAPVDQLRVVLDVLAERVARFVESERSTGDVADHQRGVYFPPELIVRDARREAGSALDGGLPLDALPETLLDLAGNAGLTDVDLSLLLVAMAVQLQSRFEHFFIVLNNDVDTRGPNIATAIRLAGYDPDDPLPRSRLRPGMPLLRYELLELSPATRPLLTRVLTVPERVVAHVLGDNSMDLASSRLIEANPEVLVPFDALPELEPIDGGRAVFLCRPGTAAIQQAQRWILTKLECSPLLVNGQRLSAEKGAYEQQLAECGREAVLRGTPVIFDLRDLPIELDVSVVVDRIKELHIPCAVLVQRRAVLEELEMQQVELPVASSAHRIQWWNALGADEDLAITAEAVTHVEPEHIRAHLQYGKPLAEASLRKGDLVDVIEPKFMLKDVITNDEIREGLAELRDRVRFRTVVLDEWQMNPGGGRGRGITALFSGSSGTGKSMAAEALAGELGVPLFRVNLATVVDKYIGETEKKLDRVFSTVEDVDGVLLFDEADALFGRRSDVSDARDRYANVEVAYLLQRMESFDGLAVLTTNMRANLDEAFLRRLASALDFPEPTVQERKLLWLACLAGNLGTVGENDIQRLATLSLTGGSIRAASITAAYLAAARGEQLNRLHLLKGAQREWRKQGRLSLPTAEFEQWFSEVTNVGADQ